MGLRGPFYKPPGTDSLRIAKRHLPVEKADAGDELATEVARRPGRGIVVPRCQTPNTHPAESHIRQPRERSG